MYMVFISFHSYNAVTFGIANNVYLLLYIVSDRTSKQLLAVLRNKNYMHFKTILTPVVAIISVIHRGLLMVKFQPLALFSIMVVTYNCLTFTNNYYIIYLVKLQRG